MSSRPVSLRIQASYQDVVSSSCAATHIVNSPMSSFSSRLSRASDQVTSPASIRCQRHPSVLIFGQ